MARWKLSPSKARNEQIFLSSNAFPVFPISIYKFLNILTVYSLITIKRKDKCIAPGKNPQQQLILPPCLSKTRNGPDNCIYGLIRFLYTYEVSVSKPYQGTLQKLPFNVKMVAGMLSFSVCIWRTSMLGQVSVILGKKESLKLGGLVVIKSWLTISILCFYMQWKNMYTANKKKVKIKARGTKLQNYPQISTGIHWYDFTGIMCNRVKHT